MKNLKYDLHIHSGLSPCADDDMTPYNIVAMAKIKKLDIIAITDHQSCQNVKSAIFHGKNLGVTVIPGMELETSEEFHSICLFPSLEASLEFESFVSANMNKIKNRKEIFGNQFIYSETDEIIGEEEQLLLTPAHMDFITAQKKVTGLGGVIFPAHIDRDSYSILTVLGDIPGEYKGKYIEISPDYRKKAKGLSDISKFAEKYDIIKSSDAHYLKDISEPVNFLGLNKNNIKIPDISNIINALID